MNKNFIYALLASAALLGVTSCSDEPLLPGNDKGETSLTGDRMDDAFLSFFVASDMSDGSGIGLDHLGTTEYGTDAENKIMEDKFRVLIFTGDKSVGGYDDPTGADHGNKFLFEVPKKYISLVPIKEALTDASGSPSKGYRVTISERALFDQEATIGINGPVSAEEVNDAVRKAIYGVRDENTGKYVGNGFKVVVLANYPHYVEGKRDYDPYTGDPIVNYRRIDTQDLHLVFGDDLSELSQCIYDNVYGDRYNTTVDDNGLTIPKNLAYRHFPYDVEGDPDFQYGGRMGVYSVWVKNYFTKFEKVGEFLRNPAEASGVQYHVNDEEYDFKVKFTYDADQDSKGEWKFSTYDYYRCFAGKGLPEKENSYTFENVWRVWNFNVDENEALGEYDTRVEGVKNYWYNRNYQLMLKELPMSTDTERLYLDSFDYDGLSIKDCSGDHVRWDGKKLILATTLSGNLRPVDQASLDKSIKLRVYGEGTLRIKCTAGGSGKLLVCGKTSSKTQSQARFEPIGRLINGKEADVTTADGFSVAPGNVIDPNRAETKDGYYEYVVEPNSYPYLDVFIQAHGGTINIHQIEIIRDRHLYDTGRIGVMPSDENPIPMYGCQEFDPIGQYVENIREVSDRGTFNASDRSLNIPQADPDGQYTYKRVFLLRSVAKVEVLFKESAFRNHKPTHLYLRTFNRSARCEPKDVITPTEVLWFGSAELDRYYNTTYYSTRYPSSKFVGIDQENRNIFQYGVLREDNIWDFDGSYGYLNKYYNKTAWFYGMWTEWQSHRMPNGWDWNIDAVREEAEILGTDIANVDPDSEGTGLPYPRVFNTRVDRSDYCRLTYVGTVGIGEDRYLKYVIYVPEKNIDDADDKGDLRKIAKVAHLEMRFDGMNDNYNMDDEHIYRVYFADYSTGELDQFDRDEWDNMEKENNNGFLSKYCYPIVRNHIYRFKINSINSRNGIDYNFSVCGKADREYPGTVVFQ